MGFRCGWAIMRSHSGDLHPVIQRRQDIAANDATTGAQAEEASVITATESATLTDGVSVVPAEKAGLAQAILLAGGHGNEVLAKKVQPAVDNLYASPESVSEML